MAYNIHIYLRSSDFSQEFADENNNGEESAENVRHEWEDEFRINGDFSEVEVLRDQSYLLSGEKGDNAAFSFDIPNVMTFLFHSAEGDTPIVVSEAAIDEYILDKNGKRLDIYLNDYEVVENPVPGVYLILSDFPPELRN